MIRYALRCDRNHAFESWFKDSAAFDALAALNQLSCAVCGSSSVHKAPMAPSIVRGGKDRATLIEAPASGPSVPQAQPSQAVALMGEQERKLRDMVRELHRKIAETSDDVGKAFPEEARRIHEGDTPARAIHGQATGEEVKALLDDGIPLMPIPSLPDDQN